MDLTQIRELLTQVQTGARVTTAIGDPVQIGNRVIIPVAEICYGAGGGGGGSSMKAEHQEGCGCHTGNGEASAEAEHNEGCGCHTGTGEASAKAEYQEGCGGGGHGGSGAGAHARIRPLGCWVISPNEERWLPAVDVNRLILVIGGVLMLGILTVRAIARHR